MRDRYIRPRSLLVTALVVLAAVLVSAQEERQAEPQPPSPFRTEANYVRVDVYPTEGGRPVHGLRPEDFEVLEEGVRQEIRAFEHVVITPAGPQRERIEADSLRGGEQMAADPRGRVFVFFLDFPHVAVEGSHAIKEPLIRLMDSIMGPDDVVAVMTPEMSAAQVTFGRKSQVIADMLRENWTWGMRHQLVPMDEREVEYEFCFPEVRPLERKRLVEQLVQRRRERMVLDALHDLVQYLGGIREERKAILAVTEGWFLYRPDASIMALRSTESPPGRDPVGVDGWGKLRINPPERGLEDVNTSEARCNRERMFLANIDNADHFRQLLDAANRNNASFYPIDPRGLTAFDSPIGPAAPPAIRVDMARVASKVEVLRTLAENTDGLAVVNSNDLDAGLRRVADDLTSYYLLGYYSTNTALEGGYRRITVRVKRPGIEVRARRGYRAAGRTEVAAARAAAAKPISAGAAAASAAIAALARIRPDDPFRINAVPERDGDGARVTAIWVAGEVRGASREAARGGTATVEVNAGAAGRAEATLQAGQRAFLVKIPIDGGEPPFEIRARMVPAPEGDGGDPLIDAVRVEPDGTPRPLLYRRGPATGNRVQPAADFHYSRTERLRLEVPIRDGAAGGAGRFLDRNGQPLPVPVTVSHRADPDGGRWIAAEATLAPMAPGEYVLELTWTAGREERRMTTGIRVTR